MFMNLYDKKSLFVFIALMNMLEHWNHFFDYYFPVV